MKRDLPTQPQGRTAATDSSPGAGASLPPHLAYALDFWERSVLFLDTLRRRGNGYVEHRDAGAPPLLKFEHELVLDGATLSRPCNYALLRILPPKGVPTDPEARPVVVVDPRAGHGAGIGGFKDESEVGMALRAGHPVYFVTFRLQPEDGQTLQDVRLAQARFLETVAARHPQCAARPLVIGNCQAGWAVAELASIRPEIFGVLFVIGAPLSYWAGSSRHNPMRYSAAMLGGAWLAAFASDLGADRFDGANLVQNFENLNPANSLWSKYFRLWSQVDTEAERFLEFERWWGGFFRMTGAEIESIVENRFVGNRQGASRGPHDEMPFDLRAIVAPIVVFASRGDNITPPPQALNWIIDAWGDERAIACAGRVIVYVLHDSVGHLGLFVGGEVARKEHDQLVTSLDVIENLPPGLYEMRVRLKDDSIAMRWDDLEPGGYTVQFEHRTMNDLRAANPEGRGEEQLFSTVAKFSQINTALYKSWMRPWVQAWCHRAAADVAVDLHPLRWQRQLFADGQPASAQIAVWADKVRAQRHRLAPDHPGRQWELALSNWIEATLDGYRDLRDQAVVQWTRWIFGPMGLGAWLPPDPPQERLAADRAAAQLDAAREEVLQSIGEGGIAQAICRVVLAGMVSTGAFERRSLRIARLLAALPSAEGAPPLGALVWRDLMREQARIVCVAPVEALNEVARMLPDEPSRERALAVAAAVMMIEPTLHNPRSEIIELLIGMLGVDPERVIELARELTAQIDGGECPQAPDQAA